MPYAIANAVTTFAAWPRPTPNSASRRGSSASVTRIDAALAKAANESAGIAKRATARAGVAAAAASPRGGIAGMIPGFALRELQRQRAQPLARRRRDRVRERRRERRDAGLADAGRLFRRRHDVHVDPRHLRDPQHGVIVEVRLLDGAVLQRDAAVERGGERVADAAFHLRAHVVGIDRDAAFDGADDAIDAELLAAHRHLDDLCDDGIERFDDRDAAAALFAGLAGRERFSPSGLLRREIECGEMARVRCQERAPERDGVLAGRLRELVDERFGAVSVVRRAD